MQTYQIILLVVGIVIFLSLLVCFIIGWKGAKTLTHPKLQNRETRKAYNHENGFDKGTESYSREETTFIMPDGYNIHGDITLNDKKKFVIFLHGYTSTREGMIKYTPMFYELGYSIVLYDHRGCGDNAPAFTSMGYQEAKDAAIIIDQLKERYGQDIKVGVIGVSMGGGTACLLTQYHQDLQFVVSDCGFASLKELLRDNLKNMHLWPTPILPFFSLCLKLRYGFSFKDSCPMKVLRRNNVPLLIYHGTNDEIVNIRMADILLKNNFGKTDIFYSRFAGHGKSLDTRRDQYINKLYAFIDSLEE